MKRKSSGRQEAVQKSVGPAAHRAAGRISAIAVQVSPYTHKAAIVVVPYAQRAVGRVGPFAVTAKQRGARAVQDAVGALGPRLDDAFVRLTPAVEVARGKVIDELLPRLSGALSAAAATPVVVEATKPGKAARAAAKGALSLPDPARKDRSWPKALVIIATVAGVVAVVVKKFLDTKDADTQAASPTTADVPTTGAERSSGPAVDVPSAAATDGPRPGESTYVGSAGANIGDASPAEAFSNADLLTDAVEPAAQAPVVDDEVLVEPSFDATFDASGAPVDDVASVDEVRPVQETGTAAVKEHKYTGEGAYVGSEPPEGFVIKGNERAMKYHTPDSGGYSSSTAEVWFNSEEAAEQAGFTHAQD